MRTVVGTMVLFCMIAGGQETPAAVTNKADTAPPTAPEPIVMPTDKTLVKSGIALRLIPAGTFTMGSPESEKGRAASESLHTVTLSKPFYLGKYEITQAQWKRVMGKNPSCFTNSGDKAPVEGASWTACTNFIRRLAALEGIPDGYLRLPTEAQWEYACRAGTTSSFCYGESLDSEMANFYGILPVGKGAFLQKTESIGRFKPNAWGLHDMHGNVEEWCADWFGDYAGDATDPTGPTNGWGRVIRGGSWIDSAAGCRSAERGGCIPDIRSNRNGFRITLPASP